MGRDMRRWDVVPQFVLRALKYAANPRALRERVFKGPVYGRSAKAGR